MNSGPDTIGEQMLRASIDPDTGANYTEAEAQSFMAKEGWQLMQEEMVEQLLAHRLDTGGLSQEDIRVISTTKWGQGMVDKALENNDSFRSAVEKVYGKDALNRHTFWERWADKRESHSFIFYLLLGMIPPLVFTAISAAKEDPLKESIAA